MKLQILGYHSAIPTAGTNPTAQVITEADKHYLIDCGEGTQVQLRKAGIRFARLDNIFISHLHGDHVFGLVGLISSLQLLGRDKPLTIFGPKGIKKLIEIQLEITHAYSNFNLEFIELTSKESEKIFENNHFEVHTIPLKHRVYANGFLFKQKVGQRKLNIETIKKHPEIEVCDYHNIKSGKDFQKEDGSVILNHKLTFDPSPTKSYAFCSDTCYHPPIVELIQGVDLLYHEATFLHDRLVLAKKTGHSTAKQAAMIAKEANVKKLIIGHFSNRYNKNQDVLRQEAATVFENVHLPKALESIEI